jgi:hypothetical protein
MAIFMDIEFVCLNEAEPPHAFAVTFDVIYAGETWCRSEVLVDGLVAAALGFDERQVTGSARDALLELLASETGPVSFVLRLGLDGTTVMGRATPR